MKTDTYVTIAYRCCTCGAFEFFSISLNETLQKGHVFLTCRCKKSGISLNKSANARISVPCIGCSKEHEYVFQPEAFSHCEVIEYNCPSTGIQICFMGNDMHVRKKIDNLERELDSIIDGLGYESYFANTRVMLDSINRIHDIADMGNLSCRCASGNIELIPYSDRIELICSKCHGESIIKAASNEDLKRLRSIHHIFLEKLQNTT